MAMNYEDRQMLRDMKTEIGWISFMMDLGVGLFIAILCVSCCK